MVLPSQSITSRGSVEERGDTSLTGIRYRYSVVGYRCTIIHSLPVSDSDDRTADLMGGLSPESWERRIEEWFICRDWKGCCAGLRLRSTAP